MYKITNELSCSY